MESTILVRIKNSLVSVLQAFDMEEVKEAELTEVKLSKFNQIKRLAPNQLHSVVSTHNTNIKSYSILSGIQTVRPRLRRYDHH